MPEKVKESCLTGRSISFYSQTDPQQALLEDAFDLDGIKT